MEIYSTLLKPTLLLEPSVAIRNIEVIAEKARRQNIHFRPHFKTHQSYVIAEWFRPYGVNAITVSSIEMAEYFVKYGWEDIIIAFPVNLRQVAAVQALAEKIHLGLLVESQETVEFLANRLEANVDLWIKVDVGAHRTGIVWDSINQIESVARHIQKKHNFHLRGLLTHAGHTYTASSREEVCHLYQESVYRLKQVQAALESSGIDRLELSVGDTPSASSCEDLGEVDEIRPGNFIFYDAHQLNLGSCTFDQIAVAVACPIVARHVERNEIVVYGGAIHLSKDTTLMGERRIYGLVSLPVGNRWGAPIPQAYVHALSQEHGIIHLLPEDLSHLQVGDLVCILPAHSCLTVQALRNYVTMSGEFIPTLNSEPSYVPFG